MTNPVFTDIVCSVCGSTVGKRPGIQVVPGVICEDAFCQYQPAAELNVQRDSYVVAGALAGVPASLIAFATDMSRQRVYQILDGWKKGV